MINSFNLFRDGTKNRMSEKIQTRQMGVFAILSGIVRFG